LTGFGKSMTLTHFIPKDYSVVLTHCPTCPVASVNFLDATY
jgi:hypothetical protein